MTRKIKTISGIDVDPAIYAVLQEMARVGGEVLQKYCVGVLEAHVEEMLDSADFQQSIGQKICERWKKSLA